MKNVSLINYIRNSVEDDYAMSVFYNIVKNSFVNNGFSLSNVSSIYIDGRFFGKDTNISLRAKYNKTPNHVLALLLSVRLLMLNPKLVKYCNEDKLIITSRIDESFQWIEFMAFILDNWEDNDIKMLYSMLENFYFDDEFTEEEKKEFRDTIKIPEYRNERGYYKGLASTTTGVANQVIGNNAFLEAEIGNYVITEDIEYVGDTAFSYCESLETLEFEGKTMFGTFPIVECNNLKQIIVPNDMKSYYSECLPYYRGIIKEKQDSGRISLKEEVSVKVNPQKETDVSEIEHVYVDIPSAAPYTEIEVTKQETQSVKEEERKPIDVKMLQTVFEKKATSYKYFWMLAIISLAKENSHMSISFNDITIRMAALAWPIVFEDEIELGSSDMMKKYLEAVVKKTTLIKGASSNVVENYLKQHFSSQGVDKILSPLMKNVPYRFLSPWIKYTTDEDVTEKSCAKSFNGLYALHSNYIILDEEWWEYIDAHYLEICDFAVRSFIAYAKKYNNDMKLVKLMTTGWQLIRR